MLRHSQVARLLLPAMLLTSRPFPLRAQTHAAQGAPPATLKGDTAHPAGTHDWLETRLFFGLGPIGAAHTGVGEVAWRRFVDTEVTPRFPDGLSVIDVDGQWLGKLERARHQQAPTRIRSKMLLIAYPSTLENAARIDAIRAAWKARTGDQSVLKVTQPADVSF